MKHFIISFFFAVFLCFSGFRSYSITSSQITISNGTGPKFFVGTNCASGPTASYLVLNILNKGTDTLSSVKVKITKITSVTPGFKLLAPISDSSVVLSRINPNQSLGAYFYVQYPCVDAATIKFNFDISDTATGVVSDSITITVSEIQAAAAGGEVLYQNMVGLDALGILISDSVTYEFGNYNGGEILFQPNGDTLFNANEVRLLGSKIDTSAFDACGVSKDTTNVYYFNNASGCGAGTGNIVRVVYYYINTMYNDSTDFYPFAAMKSGSPVKYSSNYSTQTLVSFGTTTASNKVSLSKVADCGICTPGDTITYTVTVSNSGSDTIMLDQITDVLPSGYSFVGFGSGSDVNASNTALQPDLGSTGTITFTGKVPLQFPYRSYLIPHSSSINLIYRVKIRGTSSSQKDTNFAVASIGTNQLDTASAITCVGCGSLPVTLINFDSKKEKGGVQLRWQTASEQDNSHFSIYRRINGGPLSYVGQVAGNGNSNRLSEYTLFDQFIPRSSVQSIIYTLEQVDYNGQIQKYYSTVVFDPDPKLEIQLYPNPVDHIFHLQLPYKMNVWSIDVVDSKGTIVKQAASSGSGIGNYISINTHSLASGIYSVIFRSGNTVKSFSIAKP